ncbi:MAG: VacB/RNase II family 3'-5' exoribonuclease [Bacilli bacterium]|nr:VacB/RNase II family 3'-5' exoribonuclease [Bacilli bacterium]
MNFIISYFKQNNKGFSEKELRKNLKIKGEEQTNIFNSALKTLVEDGCLFFDGKTYKLFTPDLGLAYGEIEINQVGNGIVHTKYGIIFIDNKNLNGALNGDKVTISNITKPERKNNFEGKVFQVLKRRTGKVVFKVKGNGFDSTLIPYNENETVDIIINKNELKDLRDGDYVLINVLTEKRDNKYYAEIDKVIGNVDSKNIDVKILFEENDIPVEFPEEVEYEAKKLPTEVNESEIAERVDLRDKPILTIDCDNTKDRDDAIYVEKLPNGNYKLYVNISDVSYYVKRGTKLFEEALRRCNSHYINNTCNPMFPIELSNGICSLNANLDRLTKTVEMEINDCGEVVNYEIYKSVINSKKAMKYSNVNKVLNGEVVPGYEEFAPQLKLMNELKNILEEARYNRNYIDFDIRDVEQVENKAGEVIDFKQADVGNAQLIIENFMVIANETVAKHFYWLPFVFRIHEAPDEASVKDVLDLLRVSGYDIPHYKNVDEKTLKGVLKELSKIDKLDIAKSMVLRRMKRAKYCVNNLGHYALQLKNYCHFTSPIRRIADFMIHTIIDEVDTLDYSSESMDRLEKEMQTVCENASRTEKLSKELEDKGMLIQMAKYMEKYIGKTFEAYISEIYQHGMLAKTENMIVGKIKFDDISDDKYYFDSNKNAVIGKKTKNKYTIGQKVYVIVKDASKANRTISFKIEPQKVKKI